MYICTNFTVHKINPQTHSVFFYFKSIYLFFMKQFLFASVLLSVLACSPEDGPKGPKGQTGDSGKDGINGQNGPSGPTGPAGDKGATGLVGDQGPKGTEGMLTTYYSGWKELDWQYEDDYMEDGSRYVHFLAKFEEKSLTANALKNGSLKVFLRELNNISQYKVKTIVDGVWYAGKLSDNATNYQVSFIVEEGTVYAGINLILPSGSASLESLTAKLKDSKIALQTYIIHN